MERYISSDEVVSRLKNFGFIEKDPPIDFRGKINSHFLIYGEPMKVSQLVMRAFPREGSSDFTSDIVVDVVQSAEESPCNFDIYRVENGGFAGWNNQITHIATVSVFEEGDVDKILELTNTPCVNK